MGRKLNQNDGREFCPRCGREYIADDLMGRGICYCLHIEGEELVPSVPKKEFKFEYLEFRSIRAFDGCSSQKRKA